MKTNSSDSRKARAMLTVSRIVVYAILIFLSFLCLFFLLYAHHQCHPVQCGPAGRLPAAAQHEFPDEPEKRLERRFHQHPRGLANSFFVAACTALLTTYFSPLTAYGPMPMTSS